MHLNVFSEVKNNQKKIYKLQADPESVNAEAIGTTRRCMFGLWRKSQNAAPPYLSLSPRRARQVGKTPKRAKIQHIQVIILCNMIIQKIFSKRELFSLT